MTAHDVSCTDTAGHFSRVGPSPSSKRASMSTWGPAQAPQSRAGRSTSPLGTSAPHWLAGLSSPSGVLRRGAWDSGL